MADFEKSLISKVIHSGDIKDVLERKVHSEMFEDDRNKKVFIFLMNYYTKYGEIPPIEVMDHEFAEYKLAHTKEPVNYCIDKIIEQYVRNKGSDIILKHTNKIVADPMSGLEDLKNSFNSLNVEANPTMDSNFMQSIDERKKHYERLKSMEGIDGYPTPWEVLNEVSQGWHPEDFIVIVARTSVGKSWQLVILMEHLWKENLSVLFVTNEMSTSQIERRLDAVHFKLPYQEFRAGLLPDHHEKRYFEGLEKLKQENRKDVITIGNIGGVNAIESKIDQYQPDIVFVDGMYLLHDDRMGRTKWERTSNISWDLKRMAKKKKLPVIATTQFNRSAEGMKFDQVTLGSLGFADSIGYDADVIMGLFRNQDMVLHNEMYVRMLKVREGEPKDFTLNWDLKEMNFSVLSVDDSNEVIDDGEIDDEDLDY